MPSRRQLVRLIVLAVILSSCIGCDRITKQLAQDQLRGGPAYSYFHGAVRLEYAENPGAFLGMGGNLPPAWRHRLLGIANGGLLVLLGGLLATRRKLSWPLFVAISLILAGGIGNLIDRLGGNGRVIDFLNVGVGPLRSGIFNVADVAITAGALVWFCSRAFASEPPICRSAKTAR